MALGDFFQKSVRSQQRQLATDRRCLATLLLGIGGRVGEQRRSQVLVAHSRDFKLRLGHQRQQLEVLRSQRIPGTEGAWPGSAPSRFLPARADNTSAQTRRQFLQRRGVLTQDRRLDRG